MFEVQDKGTDKFRAEVAKFEQNYPKQAKIIMGRVGTKCATIVRKRARKSLKKHSGNFFKSIKRGKVLQKNGKTTVRVYSKSHVIHAIEEGHRIVDRNKVEHGFKKGYWIFKNAKSEVEKEFDNLLVKEFDKMIKKMN